MSREGAWFSAMVRLADIIGEVGAERYVKSVFVFRARDWDEALVRAVELGRALEEDHPNADGERVVWRLMDVETLDMLGEVITDGREVYSEPVPAGPEGKALRVDTTFWPEKSKPTQTGV